MNISPAALAAIRNLRLTDSDGKAIPGSETLGRDLYEALNSIQKQGTVIEQQTNSNANAQPQAPPNVQSLSVSANNGHFNFSIQDQSQGLSRGVHYFVEHADNAAFANSHTIDIGQSRNHNEYLGNVTRYVRAYSAYPGSPPSQHVYFGGMATPKAVAGGGTNAGPDFLPSQGTGTGAAGQGGVGPGPVPKRTNNSGFNWNAQQVKKLA